MLLGAGMRGAVTLVAAQSLFSGTTQRSLLVLIAFIVATGTLQVHGSTLSLLVRRLGLIRPPRGRQGRRRPHCVATSFASSMIS